MNFQVSRYYFSKSLPFVFALSIPILLITSNVRLAFDSLTLYRYGFEQYSVMYTTGLDMDQLLYVAEDIRNYFNSSDPLLDTEVVIGGDKVSLFNEREISHMSDVKRMVKNIHIIQICVGTFIASYVVLILIRFGRRSVNDLLSQVLRASLLTAMAIVVLGGLFFIGFDQMFHLFHTLSFEQGTWTFDPRYNYLTRLFTVGFFQDTMFMLALSVALQALLIGFCTMLTRRLVRKYLPISTDPINPD